MFKDKTKKAIFHLAYPMKNKEETRLFYTNILGCPAGREDETWIDFNFFGNQLSFHLCEKSFLVKEPTNLVDGKDVPIRHFGAVLEWKTWHALKDRLIKHKLDFIIDPYIRFKDQKGEQATMFFNDPSGNSIEFKSFKNISQVFEK
ncbi:MAG: glyoxalase [Hellea sp.]